MKLWECIPRSEFELPHAPTEEAARGGALRVWRWLKQQLLPQSVNAGGDRLPPSDHPSAEELERIPCRPNWTEAAHSLDAEVGQWLGFGPGNTCPIRAVVGPPGCDVASILETIAQRRELPVLKAPPADVFDGLAAAEYALPAAEKFAGQTLVIPQWERFFRRRDDGMDLIRMLAERMTACRRVLVGCDSWTWAFLDRALGLEAMLGEPLALAPFDEARLDGWLRSICDLRATEFRQNRNGDLVFPAPTEKSERSEDFPPPSTVIKSLAARSRGNPGVALALWRRSLRKHEPQEGEAAPRAGRMVMRVAAPSELELPNFPAASDRSHRLLAHVLLVHGGLSLSSLITVLPFSGDEVRRRVSELTRAGVLEEEQDMLRVALIAYPNVRRELAGEGFLVDAF